MAKKQKSFEEKTSSSKGNEMEHIKFVKSVPSGKEGYWRFNESMVALEKGQKLDAALKQMEDEANLVDIEMPSEVSNDETDQENKKSEETIVKFEEVTKQYGDLVVLDKLNLDIKKNEMVSIIGPSGSGKTTV